ncbi:unnamed protein product [Mucor hiemalis]
MDNNNKLTKKEITIAFKDHDINETGLLDADYLYKALLSLNLPVEPSDMADLFECVGREKEKMVAMDDFVDIVMELKADETMTKEPEGDEYNDFVVTNDAPSADTAFQMLVDPAVNGITLESLLKVCATQEDSWTEQQVREMMNEADLNHDGMIDTNEFRIVCEKAGL